jgi:hypothetical protein
MTMTNPKVLLLQVDLVVLDPWFPWENKHLRVSRSTLGKTVFLFLETSLLIKFAEWLRTLRTVCLDLLLVNRFSTMLEILHLLLLQGVLGWLQEDVLWTSR